jgi:GDP-L-fucose synthase
MDAVLVTGANGMVGSCVREYLESKKLAPHERKWVFISADDADLRNWEAVNKVFNLHRPTHVLHCAARLSSASDMTAHPVEFWMDNVQINNNVLRAAHTCNARVVSILSTVMLSKDATFPVQGTPEDIFGGQLHAISHAYGFAKRALAHLSQWYREQYACKFSCILPSNIFGPHGAFDSKNAPLLNALIAKAVAARESGQNIVVMGTGAPLRQMLYARDLARILVWALDNYDDALPLFVAGEEEVSVRDLAEMACQATGVDASCLRYDVTIPDGPLRRTADTSRFRQLLPEFAATPLQEAIAETVNWYAGQHHAMSHRDIFSVADKS